MTTTPARLARLARLRRVAGAVAGVALVGAGAWYLVQQRDELAALRGVGATALGAVVALRIADVLLANVVHVLLLRATAPRLGHAECFALTSGGAVASLAFPGAGFAAKTLYLKDVHGASAAAAAGLLALQAATYLVSAGLVGAAALALLAPVPPALWLVALATVGAGAVPLVAGATVAGRSSGSSAGGGFFARLAEAMRAARGRLPLALLVHLVRAVAAFAATGILWAALVPGASVLAGGTVSALTALLKAVKLTPGSIGTLEWLSALIGRELGFTAAQGLAAAAVSRALGFAIVAAGGALALALLRRARRARGAAAA